MIRTIGNSRLTVSVKQCGAELCGIRGSDGTEYLWQADPAVWNSQSPLLFPIVGKLNNGCYRFAGRTYVMNQHGFARGLDFEHVSGGESSLVYRLRSSPETLSQYPFEFVLTRQYRLDADRLEVVTEVANTGTGVMPFSIGEHPGFSLEWREGNRIEDYYLEFEKQEQEEAALLDDGGRLSARTVPVITGGNRLPLRRDLFNQDALIFTKLNSRRVALCSLKSNRRVTVDFPGYPCLGVWAKPAAPYVCIEPWYGHADPVGHDGELASKPGLIKLDPGARFACQWRVEVSGGQGGASVNRMDSGGWHGYSGNHSAKHEAPP